MNRQLTPGRSYTNTRRETIQRSKKKKINGKWLITKHFRETGSGRLEIACVYRKTYRMRSIERVQFCHYYYYYYNSTVLSSK